MGWRDVRDELSPEERLVAEEMRANIRARRAWGLLLLAAAGGNVVFWLWLASA